MQKWRIFACIGYEGNISNEYTSKDPRIYEIIEFLKIWETEIHGCEFGWTELFDNQLGCFIRAHRWNIIYKKCGIDECPGNQTEVLHVWKHLDEAEKLSFYKHTIQVQKAKLMMNF